MRAVILTAILAILIVPIVFGQAADGGAYARRSVSIWGAEAGVVLAAPNHKAAIRVEAPPSGSDYPLVVVEVNGHIYKTEFGSWVDAEVAWSPDSKAFFITYSDGGNVGTFHVKVVHVSPTGIEITEPIANGRLLFAPRCFDAEMPNVGAVKWASNDSSRLIIAVEVPPHSSCASMGTFRAFEIALPTGRVSASYSQIAAKKAFSSDLGRELMVADDGCITRPRTCIPSGMDGPK